MPLSNSWDETHPAGSDFVSSLDDQGRQLKLDIRERLSLQHYWASSVSGNNEDGIHKEIAITPTGDNIWILKTNVNQIISGAASTALVDIGVTWNTSGAPTGLKLSVTDTLSNAASLLADLQVGGVSKFSVKKDGSLVTGSIPETLIPDGTLLARVGSAETVTAVWTFNSATNNLKLGSAGAPQAIVGKIEFFHTVGYSPMGFTNTTGNADEKYWQLIQGSNFLSLRAVNDANSGTTDLLKVTRFGYTTSTIDVIGNLNATQGLAVPTQALGAGAGPNINAGQNSSGSKASGTVSIVNVGGLQYFLWPDNTGVLRIGAVAPTTSGGDTGGGVVGAQTSNLEAKNIIRPFSENDYALHKICGTPLFRWSYKNGAMLESDFMGVITDYSPFLGMDNGKSLNVASAIGYLIASVKELERRTRTI